MSRKPHTDAPPRYRVIAITPPDNPYDEVQHETWEAYVAESLNEIAEDGYSIAAVAVLDDVLVYTLERKP